MESRDDDFVILSVPVQYALFVMWCVVIVLSIVTVVALLIPLLKIQSKQGTFRQQRRRRPVNGPSSSSTQPRRRPNEPSYSTYNLYMVYLALIDGIVFLPELVLLLPPGNSEMTEKLDLTMAVFSTPYVVANMWINAVVAHQVFLLLQKSPTRGNASTNRASHESIYREEASLCSRFC